MHRSHYYWSPSVSHYWSPPVQRGDWEAEDDTGCCCRGICACLGAWILGLLGCLGALLCLPFPTGRSDASTPESSSKVLLVGLGASLVLWLGLVSNSGLDTGTALGAGASVWTLYAGETQRILLPWMVRALQVSVVPDSTSDPDLEAAVFSFVQSCPPLNGPPLLLEHDSDLDLAGGDFEYDYYYFSPGSTVDVRIHQLVGGTYFYLLKGADALRDLQMGTNLEPSHWESIAVAQQYVTNNGSVHYRTKGSSGDVYTLVYDNESSRRQASLDVETDLVLTTYNLAGFSPWCDHMSRDAGSTCFLPVNQNNCIILEAFSKDQEELSQEERAAGPTTEKESTSRSGTIGQSDRMISLRLEVYRNWRRIFGFPSIPFALSLLVRICQLLLVFCCGTANDNLEGEPLLGEPLILPEEQEESAPVRPPPTAPGYVPVATAAAATHPQPSAPVEEGPPVIVIPPESVEPVPVDDSMIANASK